jgi:hypothetical protein
MESVVLIVAAAIMAVFGMISYQRGTRFGIMITVLVWGGLIVVGRAGNQVAKLVNGFAFGVRLMMAGGLQALGGGEDRAEALRQAIARVGPVQPLIPADQPGAALVLVLFVVLSLGLLLGMLNVLKGAASLAGLVLGLINGYVIVAALLAVLAPEVAFLPLPFNLGGAAVAAATAGAAIVPSSASQGVMNRIQNFLKRMAEGPGAAIVIAAFMALFVILATRFGNRGGKKG